MTLDISDTDFVLVLAAALSTLALLSLALWASRDDERTLPPSSFDL